jgi:hypothetical protein
VAFFGIDPNQSMPRSITTTNGASRWWAIEIESPNQKGERIDGIDWFDTSARGTEGWPWWPSLLSASLGSKGGGTGSKGQCGRGLARAEPVDRPRPPSGYRGGGDVDRSTCTRAHHTKCVWAAADESNSPLDPFKPRRLVDNTGQEPARRRQERSTTTDTGGVDDASVRG